MQTRSRVAALTLAGSAVAVAFAGVTVGAQTPDDDGSATTLVAPPAVDDTTTTLPGGTTPVLGAENPFAGAAVTFNAFLSSGQEVPPTRSTAFGTIELSLEAGASGITWSARFVGLDAVSAGHLHLAPVGQNGPVVVPLFGELVATGPFLEAEGTITEADLAGPLEGGSLDDLVAHIARGEVYANVHTSDGVDDEPEPGDYPDGEIRGQVLVWTVSAVEPTEPPTTEPTEPTTGEPTTPTTDDTTSTTDDTTTDDTTTDDTTTDDTTTDDTTADDTTADDTEPAPTEPLELPTDEG